MRQALLAGVAVLTSCGERTAEPVAQPTFGAGGQAVVAAASATGERLYAEVSELSASKSGLNVRVSDTSRIVELASDILFAFDDAVLRPDAEDNLVRTADMIRAAPPGELRVIGHTDAKGDDAYNLALSERRAAVVADWLRQQVGVRQRRIDEGRGETEPITPTARADGSDDPDGRARNRRVEVLVPR